MVEIPFVPESVNVLVSEPSYAWTTKESLAADCFVVPVLYNASEEVVITWCSLPQKVPVRAHAVELAFALTFHKVQGKTVQRVILDLNLRPFNPHLSFTALLVAISRVRKSSDFRLLRAQPGQTFDHLLRLVPDKDLSLWLSGFRNNCGIWDPSLVVRSFFWFHAGLCVLCVCVQAFWTFCFSQLLSLPANSLLRR